MADQDPVATAKDLTGAVNVLAAEVKRLRKYGRTNRRFVLFDIALTVGLTLFGALAVHAASQAAHANSAQLALCQASNVARAQQVTLWDHVIGESHPRSKEQAHALAAFGAYVHMVFRPRNCAALGSRKP